MQTTRLLRQTSRLTTMLHTAKLSSNGASSAADNSTAESQPPASKKLICGHFLLFKSLNVFPFFYTSKNTHSFLPSLPYPSLTTATPRLICPLPFPSRPRRNIPIRRPPTNLHSRRPIQRRHPPPFLPPRRPLHSIPHLVLLPHPLRHRPRNMHPLHRGFTLRSRILSYGLSQRTRFPRVCDL